MINTRESLRVREKDKETTEGETPRERVTEKDKETKGETPSPRREGVRKECFRLGQKIEWADEIIEWQSMGT